MTCCSAELKVYFTRILSVCLSPVLQSVYPPMLSRGLPQRHHIVIYMLLHSSLSHLQLQVTWTFHEWYSFGQTFWQWHKFQDLNTDKRRMDRHDLAQRLILSCQNELKQSWRKVDDLFSNKSCETCSVQQRSPVGLAPLQSHGTCCNHSATKLLHHCQNVWPWQYVTCGSQLEPLVLHWRVCEGSLCSVLRCFPLLSSPAVLSESFSCWGQCLSVGWQPADQSHRVRCGRRGRWGPAGRPAEQHQVSHLSQCFMTFSNLRCEVDTNSDLFFLLVWFVCLEQNNHSEALWWMWCL